MCASGVVDGEPGSVAEGVTMHGLAVDRSRQPRSQNTIGCRELSFAEPPVAVGTGGDDVDELRSHFEYVNLTRLRGGPSSYLATFSGSSWAPGRLREGPS